MERAMEGAPQSPEASQMEKHMLSSCFSCPPNTGIAVTALDLSLGFLISWSTSVRPHGFGGPGVYKNCMFCLPPLPSSPQLQEQAAQLLKEKLLFTTSHPESGKQLQLQRSYIHLVFLTGFTTGILKAMDHGVISGANPCGLVCKWEHRTARQETASQNPFRDENWLQKKQPSQVLAFTDTGNPAGRFSLHKVCLLGWLSSARRSQCWLARCSGRAAPGLGLPWHWPKLKRPLEKPVPWKMPAVIPQGPAQGLSSTRATQPGCAHMATAHAMNFQQLPTHCSGTEGQGGALCCTEQLWEKGAKTRAQTNGSLPSTHDKQIFRGQEQPSFCCLEATSCFYKCVILC